MKILVSCIPFDRGKSGISIYVRNVVAELAAEGHTLTLLVEPGAAGFFPGFHTVEAPGWTRRAVCSMLWHLLILPFRIRRKEYDFCLITAANRRTFAFYPLFTVAVVHDLAQYHVVSKYDRFRMFYLKHVLPFFVRRAPAVLAISRSTARDLETYWRVPAKKIRVVYNGLPLPEAGNPKHDWQERNGLAGERYILYISRIESPGKNHLNLIRAFELLPEELASRVRLVCAGADWHGAEAVHAAAARSPRGDRILFTGFLPVEDLEDAYRNASCYVFPLLFRRVRAVADRGDALRRSLLLLVQFVARRDRGGGGAALRPGEAGGDRRRPHRTSRVGRYPPPPDCRRGGPRERVHLGPSRGSDCRLELRTGGIRPERGLARHSGGAGDYGADLAADC